MMVREPVRASSDELRKGQSETEKPEQAEEDEGGEEEGEEEEGEEEDAEKAAPPGQMPPPMPPPGQAPQSPVPPKGRGSKVVRPGAVADTNKSDLSEADLIKSLEALQRIADNGTPATRKDMLLEKARTEQLSKGETDELFSLMGGQQQVTASLADAVTGGMRANDTIQKAIDVSDYLASHQEEMVKALGSMAQTVEQQDRRQHEFNLVLAKAMVDMGSLVKAISDRLGVVESQPAYEAKSMTAARVLNKSFAGAAPTGNEQMTRGMVLQAMTDMMEKSCQTGNNGLAPCGEDLVGAVAKYEQTGLISKSLQGDVVEFRKSRSA